MATQEEAYRRGLADGVVRIAAARFWPNVRLEELGAAVKINQVELQEAVRRFVQPVTKRPRRLAMQTKSAASAPRRPSVKRDTPPGMKWCSKHNNGEGAFVPVEDMGRNRSRPDGLSDTCRACWREYWRERRARGTA